MRTQRSLIVIILVSGAIALGLVFWQGIQLPRAQEPAESSALPEGSASVIGSVNWQLSGDDPVALHIQAKAVIEQVTESVIVKETEQVLIVSLPTKELAALRQKLDKVGSVGTPEAESFPSAPTTLLRLSFVRP